MGRGEGGQQITSVAVDPDDASHVVFGTDVGGLFHSLDGGATYVACNTGFEAVGCYSMVIDPKNTDRLFVQGHGGSESNHGDGKTSNGIYRSVDRGLTWEWVYTNNSNYSRDRRDQIAVDPGSYDAQKDYCTIIYHAVRNDENTALSKIIKSTDGGDTWQDLAASAGSYWIAVHPTNGYLYAGKGDGLYRSKNGGSSFTRVFPDIGVRGIDVKGDNVYIAGSDQKIYVSGNSGDSFNAKASRGIPSNLPLISLKVCPANSSRMIAGAKRSSDRYYIYSHNGGDDWSKSGLDQSESFFKGGGFGNYPDFGWHPTNPDIVWSHAHDHMIKSVDGGANFEYASDGYNGIFLGQQNSFHLNVHNPDYIALPSVDWNGGVSFDYGDSWKRMKGPWWGWVYGAYAVEPGVWFCGVSESHSPYHLTLWVTRDNGSTFTKTQMTHTGVWANFSCYQDPVNPDIWFYYDYRSANAGEDWQAMGGCRGVLTHNPQTNALYGWGRASGGSVVTSTDQGQTWEEVFSVGGTLMDIAVDHINGYIYAIKQGSTLFKYNVNSGEQVNCASTMPKDQKGHSVNLWSVAVDPVDPEIIYAANGAHRYIPDNSVLRSTDGGASWQSLTVAPRWNNDQYRIPGGGSCVEALWVRVHPETREAWFGTNDFGFWKIGPPGEGPVNARSRSRPSIGPRIDEIQTTWLYSLNGRRLSAAKGRSILQHKGLAPGVVIVEANGELRVTVGRSPFSGARTGANR